MAALALLALAYPTTLLYRERYGRAPFDDETETFLLATREEGAHGEMEVYSPSSPLGKALNGAKDGETVEYELPNGKLQKVTLITAFILHRAGGRR